MPRTGITQDAVWDAADRVSSAGENVTKDSVRAELGGTGSFDTILRHLRSWREHQQIQPDSRSADIPDSVSDIASKALHTIWSEATRLASEEAKSVRETCTRQTAALEAELQDALDAVQKVENQRDTLEQQLAKTRREAEKWKTAARKSKLEAKLLAEQLREHQDRDRELMRRIEGHLVHATSE